MNPPDEPSTPPAEPTPSRAKPGFIDQDLEDAMTLADNCHREAGKPDIAPLLAEREWEPEDQTALAASFTRCETLVEQIRTTRTSKSGRTRQEETARRQLLLAFDPILAGARRTFRDDPAQRKAFGIGLSLANTSTIDLLTLAKYVFGQLVPETPYGPAAVTLKGVKTAEALQLGALHATYKDADWAQHDAQKDASNLLAQLREEIEGTLNPLRRDLQGAADQAYTHRSALNAAQRKAFGLQATRPLVD